MNAEWRVLDSYSLQFSLQIETPARHSLRFSTGSASGQVGVFPSTRAAYFSNFNAPGIDIFGRYEGSALPSRSGWKFNTKVVIETDMADTNLFY